MARSAMLVLVLLALAAALVAANQPRDTIPAVSKKIVLVATPLDHPWASHMYVHECNLLAHCLNQTPGVHAVVSPDMEWPSDPAVMEDAACVVYYSRYAGDIVLGEAHRSRFLEMMKGGAGFVAIHWATKAEDQKLVPEYLDILGGAFHSFEGWGLDTSTRPLVQVDPASPVCRGWKPFDHHEEWYLGCRFHEQVHPVLQVEVNGKDEVVAWTFEREGGGRSFGTTLGHFHASFTDDSVRRAMVNGILWAAKIKVPEGGAPVEIPEDLRTLPPEPGK